MTLEEAPQPANDDITVVAFNALPFEWADGAWEVFVVELPNGETANCLVLTHPSGQVGMFFSPDAMAALGAKAARASRRAKLHVQGEKVLDAITEARNGHRR